jgi:hypothetical protein
MNLKQISIFSGRGSSLEILEQVAKANGSILVPASCIDPNRPKEFLEERYVKAFSEVFYVIRDEEVTLREYEKLLNYK